MAHMLPTDPSAPYHGPHPLSQYPAQNVPWTVGEPYSDDGYEQMGRGPGVQQWHAHQRPYHDAEAYTSRANELSRAAAYTHSYDGSWSPQATVPDTQAYVPATATMGISYASYYDTQVTTSHSFAVGAPYTYPTPYQPPGYPEVDYGASPGACNGDSMATAPAYARAPSSDFAASSQHFLAKQSESGHDPTCQNGYGHPGAYVTVANSYAPQTYAPTPSYPRPYAPAPENQAEEYVHPRSSTPPRGAHTHIHACKPSPVMGHLPLPEECAQHGEARGAADWQSPTPSLTQSDSRPPSTPTRDSPDNTPAHSGPSAFTFIPSSYSDGEFSSADGRDVDGLGIRRGGRRCSSAQKPPKKEPFLACYFCRGRKIACHPQNEDNEDRTCTQCAKRHLVCEYPLKSRRGQRKSSKDEVGAEEGACPSQRDTASSAH